MKTKTYFIGKASLAFMAVLLGFSLSASCGGTGEGDGDPGDNDNPQKEWTLVWSDEFDAGSRPDASKWGYETGFVRNEELQYYTDRPENVFIRDGALVMRLQKEEPGAVPNKDYNSPRQTDGNAWKAKDRYATYTSGSVSTRGKFSFTYGRVDVRAKLPRGLGTWPAIWTLGDSGGWPAGGEIDIMEFVGKEPENIHFNLHFQNESGAHGNRGSSTLLLNPWEDFHTYSIIWDEENIIFLIDDAEKWRVPTKSDALGAFTRNHYLKLNYAWGGAWGGPDIDESILPSEYLIDFVRIYQLK